MKHSCSTGSTSRWHYTPRGSPGTELTEDTEKTTRAKAVDPDVEKLSPPILQLSKVTLFRYTPENKVFQNISISADLESRIALVGENGSGEITLVKLLTRSASYKQLLECTQKPQNSSLHAACFQR